VFELADGSTGPSFGWFYYVYRLVRRFCPVASSLRIATVTFNRESMEGLETLRQAK
jgi:hypothetical protein